MLGVSVDSMVGGSVGSIVGLLCCAIAAAGSIVVAATTAAKAFRFRMAVFLSL
ncbi:MAG: hypothetical protein ACFCUT_08840 [Kiloniellaceae bacterium]